jgi:hypothetical protein
MANEQTGGLPIADITKANLYGQPSDIQQELLDANEAGLAALQQRYANPNWFNVAAGFFKPQLGGFAASLGSASQALGENLEKQRANELPVAQMRAQNAIMRNQMQQTQYVNKLVAGNTGPVTDELVKEAVARAPDAPATKALVDQLKTQRETQGLERQRIDTERAILTEMRNTGGIDVDTFKQRMRALDDRAIALNTTATKIPAASTAPAAPNAQMSEYDQRMQYGQGRQLAEAATPAAPATALNPAAAAIPSALTAATAAPASSTTKTTYGGQRLTPDSLKTLEQHAAQKEAGYADMLRAYYEKYPEDKTASTQAPAIAPAAAKPADAAASAAAAKLKIENEPIDVKNKLIPYPQSFNQLEQKAIDQQNEVIKANAANIEATPYAQYVQSQKLLTPGLQNSAKDTFAKLNDFTRNHQNEINQISNLLREKGGFAGALAQRGLNVSIMGYGANFGLDVKDALKNSIDKSLWNTFDNYTALLGKSVYYGLLGSGVDPNKLSKEDLSKTVQGYLTSNIDVDKTPAAQYAGIKNAQLSFEHQVDVANAWRKQYQKAVDAGSITPASDSSEHPHVLLQHNLYEARLEKERQRLAKLNADVSKKGQP